MKLGLLARQTFKQYYRYFMSFLSLTLFLILLSYVGFGATLTETPKNLSILLFMGLGSIYVMSSPFILFGYLYRETDVHHMASIPMTRMEVFISQYLLGLLFGLTMVIGYTGLTILVQSGQTMWLNQVTMQLLVLLYGYHMAIFCFLICGNRLFYAVTGAFAIFGPLLFYLVIQWYISATANGYMTTLNLHTLSLFFPFFGVAHASLNNTFYEYTLFYFGLAGVLLVLSLVAAQYRHYERCHNGIVFNMLSYVIRALMDFVFAGALLAFIQMAGFQNDGDFLFVSYLVVCLLVTYLVEMIYTKKSKVFYSLKYGVLLGIVFFIFFRSIAGYAERYIPQDVQKVYLSFGISEKEEISDAQTIENIRDIHHQLLDLPTNDYNVDGIELGIEYETGLGQASSRLYYVERPILLEVVLPYRDDDALFDVFLSDMEDFLDLLKQEKDIVLELYIGGNESYLVDNDQKRYLLTNYLEMELADAKQDRETYLKQLLLEEQKGVEVWKEENRVMNFKANYSSNCIAKAIETTFKN